MNIIKIIFDKYNRASYLVTGAPGGLTSKKPFATHCRKSPAGALNLGTVTISWRDPEHRGNLFRTATGKDVVNISVPSTYKDHFIPGIKPIMKEGSVRGLQYFMNINLDINFLDNETEVRWERDASDDMLASKEVVEDAEVSWPGAKRAIESYKNQFYIDWLIAYYYAIANNVTPFEKIAQNDKCTVLVIMRSLDSWTRNEKGKNIYGVKYYIVRIGDSSRIAILSSSLVQRLDIELIYRDSCSEVLIPWSLISMSTEKDSDDTYVIKYSLDTYKLMLITYGTNPLQYLYGVYDRFYRTLVTKEAELDKSENSCWNPDFNFRYWYVGNSRDISAFISGLGSVVNKFRRVLKPINKHKDTVAEKPDTKKTTDTPTEIADWPITNVNNNVRKEEADAYAEAFRIKNAEILRNQIILKTVDIHDICLPTSQLEVLCKYKVVHGEQARIVGFGVVDHTNNKSYILAYNSAVKLINVGIIAATFGSYKKDKKRPQILTTTTDIVIKPDDKEKTTFLTILGDIDRVANEMSNANKDNDVNKNTEVANMNNTSDIGALVDEVVGYSTSPVVRKVAEEALRKYGNLKAQGIRLTLTNKIMNSSNGPAGYAILAYGRRVFITYRTAVEMACLGIVDDAKVKGAGNYACIDTDKEIPIARVKDIKGIRSGTTAAYEKIAKTGEQLVAMLMSLKHGSYTVRPEQSAKTSQTAQTAQAVQQKKAESAADINNRLIAELNNANNVYEMALNERRNIEDNIAMAKLTVKQLENKLKEHDAKIAEYKKKLAEAHERLAKSFKY